MIINTDRHWQRWGRQDPYYGVLAEHRFSAEQIEQNRAEFFASGSDFIRDLLARFEHSWGPLQRGRALDHGCGVGRLTLPLATAFEEVVALDVAPAMIEEANRNSERANVRNIAFVPADDRLSGASGQFDFVNSHLVLQHIPVRRGLPILLGLIDRVRPGGGFHINVSVRTDEVPLRALYWASANIPGVKVWQNVSAGRAWNAPAMQMNNYPLGRIVAALGARGVTRLALQTDRFARFSVCTLMGRKDESGG
jgi:2-polyprenyl-3-methyl-5-hydroxy-6-metoxy-1,4-benzoquinol methylase